MKNYLLIVITFVLALNLNANTTPTKTTSNCRLDQGDLTLFNAPTKFVEKDLLHGIWTKELKNETTGSTEKYIYQFNDFGVLDVISNDVEGNIKSEKSFWSIQEFNNSAFLVLTDMNTMKDKLYQIEPTCDGMVLTDIAGNKSTELDYHASKTTSELNRIRAMITGKWVSTVYPYDLTTNVATYGTFEKMENAFLKYQFKKDGTYVKLFGSEMVEVLERGFWEISKDGKYILFYASEDGTTDKIHATEFAKIVTVDKKTLRIEFAHRTVEFSELFNTSLKEFSFNKK